MWRVVDFIVPQNKRFLFFRVQQKDAARKSAFFAYVISPKRRAARRKKLQNNVLQVKRNPHGKIQLFLSTFKNSRKIKGTFLPSAFQLHTLSRGVENLMDSSCDVFEMITVIYKYNWTTKEMQIHFKPQISLRALFLLWSISAFFREPIKGVLCCD